MTDYDNSNRGALFKNKDKQSDRHPDYKGSINVDGVEYFLDAWIKTAQKSGDRFMSLSVKRKDRQPEARTDDPRRDDRRDSSRDLDDEIPF